MTVRTRRIQEEIPSIGSDDYDKFADKWYATRANYDLFMKHARPGAVIVFEASHSPDVGFWGSTITLHAKAKGVGGAVADGGIRDAGEIERIGFPVFYRFHGRMEVVGRLEFRPVDVNVPVTIGGVTMRPNDIVISDYEVVVLY